LRPVSVLKWFFFASKISTTPPPTTPPPKIPILRDSSIALREEMYDFLT